VNIRRKSIADYNLDREVELKAEVFIIRKESRNWFHREQSVELVVGLTDKRAGYLDGLVVINSTECNVGILFMNVLYKWLAIYLADLEYIN